MIEAFADRLSAALKNAVPDHPYSQAKLKFGIHLLLNTSFTIIATALLGLLLGRLQETMACLFAFALLRVISGGYHFKSAVLCVVVSAAVAASLPFITITSPALFAINLVNVILVLLFAPSRIDGQTRIKKKYYPWLKVIATIIVLSNFLLQSSLLGLTWLVQAASLITLSLKGGES